MHFDVLAGLSVGLAGLFVSGLQISKVIHDPLRGLGRSAWSVISFRCFLLASGGQLVRFLDRHLLNLAISNIHAARRLSGTYYFAVVLRSPRLNSVWRQTSEGSPLSANQPTIEVLFERNLSTALAQTF